MKQSTRLVPLTIEIEKVKDDIDDPITMLRFINRMDRIFDELEQGQLYSGLIPEHQLQQYKDVVKIQTPKCLKVTVKEH